MRATGSRHAYLPVILVLVLGIGFEFCALISTQFHFMRAHSPWSEDPYNAILGVAMVAVPVVGLAIGVRLLAINGDDAPDRRHQMIRAASCIVVAVGIALTMQWTSILAGNPSRGWTSQTTALATLLTILTVAALATTGVLLREGAHTRLGRSWREDWLDDGMRVLARFPLVSERDPTPVVSWIRGHAVRFFAFGSSVGAAMLIGALTVGERWTDPWLIGWALLVATSANFAICMTGNAVAGFVARPTPRRRNLEISVVAGCIAAQLVVAFHDQIWVLIADRTVDNVLELWVLTGGISIAVGVLTYVLLRVDRTDHGTPHVA